LSKTAIKVYITEEQKEKYSKAAEQTNRSLSQFLVESADQFINRYMNKKHESVEKRVSELYKVVQEMYDTVHTIDDSRG